MILRARRARLAVVLAVAVVAGGCARTLWRGRTPDRASLVEVLEVGGAQVVRVDGKEGGRFRAVGVDLLAFGAGGRLAYPARVERGWTMVTSGPSGATAGPTWDGIGDAAFGPDGARLVYAAERGGLWRVVDGERVGPPWAGILRGSLTFSPDGAHLAYAAERDGSARVVLDGEPGPAWDGVGSLRFSGDGAHLAYLGRRGDEASLVVDGAPSAPWEAIAEFALAPVDGARLRVALLGRRAHRWHVVVDGAPGPGWLSAAGLALSPDGARVAAVVREEGGERLLVDGVAGERYDSIDWRTVRWGERGEHLVFAARKQGRAVAVVDGAPGPPFDEVGPIALGRGGRWGYLGRRGGESLLIVDGREAGRFAAASDLCFSPDGRRVALLAAHAGGPGAALVVVDGREFPFDVLVDGTLVFAPDGAHWAALAADERRRQLFITVDGAGRRPFEITDVGAGLAGLPLDEALARGLPAALLRRAVAAELALAVAR